MFYLSLMMIIKCEFSFRQTFFKGVRYHSYACSIENLEIPKNDNILEVKHKPGKSNEHVKYLQIKDCKMPQLLQDIGDTFKNVEKLMIVNSNLKSITKSDLE